MHSYLVEREGTATENLRETHAVIKDARGHRCLYRNRSCWRKRISGRRMLREYFGDGDECHMAYHFP